ncbi:replication initiation and membrane attachment family protein [Caldalkalibacillus salinus]|uniref:replication initiation and membrane attachment family protein n=1 Tax=Caldalkalibacillus salinus TaxID=2803787 RepID=UPI0019235C71|nr:DnaD domain protein [Caldalkalibacillus salinus]
MALVWNEIRPMDGFRMILSDALSPLHYRTLTHLYQPIMGANSYALYLTMAHEAEGERLFSFERNHQWLMNMMGLALDQIYQARLRLEALGLIKTYRVKKDDEFSLFEYHLIQPLSPQAFFSDDILSICLYNKVGANRYKDIRARYSSYYPPPSQDIQLQNKELTKEFHEVFSSISPSELVVNKGSEIQQVLQEWEQTYPVPEPDHETAQLAFEKVDIDLDQLRAYMMKGIVFEQVVNEDTLPIIKKLTYFYQLDEWSLSRIIQDALSVDEALDMNQFRQKAKEWYRLQEGGKPPKVIHQIQPQHKKKIHKEMNMSDEQKHLHRLENMSPLQLLKAYQGGGKVADADVKLVEELLVDYQLLPGVVNVLIEYIYLTNDFKLPKNLVTKVAAHWKRAKVEDIVQAQELAKKEHQQYKEWKNQQSGHKTKGNGSKGYSNAMYPKQVKKDTLPSWITQQENAHTPDGNEQQIESDSERTGASEASMSDEHKRKRMEQLLKALGEWEEEGKGER